MANSLIDETSPRAVFADLVAGALADTWPQPTPMASAYLVELLTEHVRTLAPPEGNELSLAEDLLHSARSASEAERVRRLRGLGDRSLFVSGFFGDSLSRCVVDIGYYCDIGRSAYANLSSCLSATVGRGTTGRNGDTWVELYDELADRFADFVDVLAGVSDRTCTRTTSLLRLYDRYLETGSPRDRARLVSLGQIPPDPRRQRFRQ